MLGRPCRSVEDVETDIAHPLAFRPLIDFRSFRPWSGNGLSFAFKGGRNSRNRSNLAILPVTIFRGRAPALSATVDKAHLGPRSLATSETPRRATAGCRRVGAQECGSWVRPPYVFNPRSRVCGVSLLATGHGITRILLIVAGSEGARPREAGTGIWPTFFDLRRFAANLKFNLRQ